MSYTQAQLLDQALGKIKKTGLFTNSVTTWNARDSNDKNWQNMKAHFIAAYDAYLESGPTTNTAGIMEQRPPSATTTAWA